MRGLIPPNQWDTEWTSLADGVVLNQAPPGVGGNGGTVQTPSGPVTLPPGTPVPAALLNPNAVRSNVVPLNAGSGGTLAILGGNAKRKLLILQNNSNATASGDTAPTFWFGLGQKATVGQSLGLAPGVGMVLDVSCPIDAIYLVIGSYSNTGGSVTINGVAVEGTPPAG